MADPFQDAPPAFDGEEDPAAEFLAREQDQLAGLEDGDDFGFNDADEGQGAGDSQFDSFGGAPPAQAQSDNFGGLEDDFTADSDANDQFENNSGMNGDTGYSAISSMGRLTIEPEKIRRWREEQATMLEEKDAAEQEQIAAMRAAAGKELEDWYKHRDEQLGKTKVTNRDAEDAYMKEIESKEPGSEFERICRLCDFNPKHSKNTRDVTRFRSILLQLKQSGLIRNVQ